MIEQPLTRRAMRSISYPFASRTRWSQAPFIRIDSLVCPQDTVTIRLPRGDYRNVGTSALSNAKDIQIDATFFIGQTIDGTPLQVVRGIGDDRYKNGEMCRYVDGNNQWLLSREACILNGRVCFMSLPTVPITFIVGTTLMENQSKMAKLLKEKVIPDIVNSFANTVTMKIVNTINFIVTEGVSPRKVVTESDIEKVLLDNIDSVF